MICLPPGACKPGNRAGHKYNVAERLRTIATAYMYSRNHSDSTPQLFIALKAGEQEFRSSGWGVESGSWGVESGNEAIVGVL